MFNVKLAFACAICAGVADGLALSPSSALRVMKYDDISRGTLYKFKNQRSGHYLVGGRHAASCAVFSNSHEVAQCPLDTSDDGFLWTVDTNGRITNKKNGLSLYTESGDKSLKLLQNVAGDDSFKWSLLSDKRIKNLKFSTYLCAAAWGEHPKDTRVRNLAWTDANKQLNTNYVPVGYTGFEWNQELEESSNICDPSGLVGNWEHTTFSEQSQPGTQLTVPLGPGSVSHTISAKVVWPSANAYPSKRAWILNVGQHGAGAHHWLWNPSSSVKSQIGVWNGGSVGYQVVHTSQPCSPDNYLSAPSGTQANSNACESSCDATATCRFASFCPSGTAGCTGYDENKCALYASCNTFDSSYTGYTTSGKPAQQYTVAHTSQPCYPDNYLSAPSGTQSDSEACVASCEAASTCRFAAFCPSGTPGCTGYNENKCALYETCNTFDSSYEGYTTYQKYRGQYKTELPANPPPSIRLTTTSEGNTMKVYVDGQLQDTLISATFDFQGAAQNVDVAKHIYASDVGFPGGSVEGVCIWNRALTAQEVAEMSADECIDNCKSKGYCCNDPSVGSNQYLSCAQACTIRSLGTPVAECNNICDETRKCQWTVNQNVYTACSSCSDLTSSCPHGVQDTTACHDGCNFNT